MSKPFPKKEIYPIFYHSRSIDSDGPWVYKRMQFIPLEHKQKITDRYEKIYQDKKGNNRKRANTFLNKVARWFHKKNNGMPPVEEIESPEQHEFITKPIIKGPGINEMKQKLRQLNEKRKR